MPVQTRTLGDVSDRVDRGVALLDSHDPSWRDRVDPMRLHMSSCTHCVLGQAFADETSQDYDDGYDAGLDILCIRGTVSLAGGLVDEPTYYGFDTLAGDYYGDLTSEWLRRLDRVDS